MRRVFWMALGAGAGVYLVRKLTKTAQAYTPAGLADGIRDLGDALRYFAEQVRAGMAEREAELRDALGLDELETQRDRTRGAHRAAGGGERPAR